MKVSFVLRPLRNAVVLCGGGCLVLALGAAVSPDAAAATSLAGGTPVVTPGGAWGTAREVAGALNSGENAGVLSVSCRSAGDCSAGGFYADGSGGHAFVVNEKNGTWGAVQEVAGRLNSGGGAAVNSVSCASAGNCSAGGFYSEGLGNSEAFVVNEKNGTWGAAQEVAGRLNARGDAQVNSVSCASAGNCSAGGTYLDRSNHHQAFVVNEKNGAWGKAQEVAGALNAGGIAGVDSVSCASVGSCSAGGSYNERSRFQAFVVNEKNGAWGKAQEVAGTLNAGGNAEVNSVSCASVGNCSAGGGYYSGRPHRFQAFVVNEKNGTWGAAHGVAGRLNVYGHAQVNSVSCASAGNCSVGGFYSGRSDIQQAFVLNEKNGKLGAAQEVAGKLNGGVAQVESVSCASVGSCSAGGFYVDGSDNQQAFVVDEKNGTWGTAEEVPGTAALNTGGNAEVDSVSCASAGNCGAGGDYTQKSSGEFGNPQAFVVNKS